MTETFKTSDYQPRVTIRDVNDLSLKLNGLTKYRTLKAILAQGQSDLDYYDSEIFRLKASLSSLEQKGVHLGRLKADLCFFEEEHSRLDKYLKDCRALSSPIHSLPPELLIEIFMLSFNSNGFGKPYWVPSGKPRESPAFRLGAVCSRWRTLALSTPCLWSRLEISFQPSWPSWVPDAINTCLERSGQHNLSLLIEGYLDNLDRPDWRSVLLSLARQSHRWGSVDVNLAVNPRLRQECLKRMDLHAFPLLASLVIGPPGQWVTLAEHAVFRNAPRLKTLKLHTNAFVNSWHRYNYNITALSLRGTNLRDTLKILRQCKGLTSFDYVHMLDKTEYSLLRGGFETGAILPAHLEQLSSLSLSIARDYTSPTLIILASLLRLPALNTLTVEQAFHMYITEDTTWTGALQTFFSESQCSESLTALSLKSFSPALGMDTVLRLVPNLSEFSLYCTSRSMNIEWDSFISCLQLSPVLDNASTINTSSTHNLEQRPLIPRLKRLSLHIPHHAPFAMDAFTRAIRSRWIPKYEDYRSEVEVDRIRYVQLKMRRSHLTLLTDVGDFDDLWNLEDEGLVLEVGVIASR
ncbi:hypothetical protein K435DRAFT_851790 [Dendrothele bispora CBS 962.96]|uniref:F-box domain-containing protein n=1 Tax=Dendrothele bispora (strain CBS 962.96) TaxID=1314807 RepID=A0A4S8MKY6_DENBC|nr:hypothetical protein K435DRAFT_851790 [Dendrothele bispora CBS 962.96]